jgi:hypothetical protein
VSHNFTFPTVSGDFLLHLALASLNLHGGLRSKAENSEEFGTQLSIVRPALLAFSFTSSHLRNLLRPILTTSRRRRPKAEPDIPQLLFAKDYLPEILRPAGIVHSEMIELILAELILGV